MSEFRARRFISFEKFSAYNYSPADSGPEGNEYAVAVILSRAELCFAESRGVRVVRYFYRNMHSFLNEFCKGKIFKS